MSEWVKRVSILNVPVDIVKEENLADLIRELADNGQFNRIILLDFAGFMKARRSKTEWSRAVNEAALVLPVSYRIINAARFLKMERPVHYRPFDFIISLMGILEERRKSAYLLGSSKKRIQKSFTNLTSSFPGLRFVGRFQGNWDKEREEDITMAIKKSSPTLLLTGRGVKGRDLWLFRNKDKFNPAIALWNRHCFEIMGGRRSKPTETKMSRFGRSFLKSVLLPWRWFLLFRQLWFWMVLTATRLFGGRKKSGAPE